MSKQSLPSTFKETANPTHKRRRKSPPQLSLRLTEEERERLKHDAGNMSVNAYIRSKLFDGKVTPRRKCYERKQVLAPADYVALAQVLGKLGESDLSTSMLVLAMAAREGTLPVDNVLEDRLRSALKDIRQMRLMLVSALGLKANGNK
jgi:hypothetical protein